MTVRLDGFAFMRVSIYQEDYRGQPRPLRREKCLRYAEFFRQMADEMPPREMLAGDIGVADADAREHRRNGASPTEPTMKGEKTCAEQAAAATFREMGLRWGEKLGMTIPEGYALVPIEPTNAMHIAGLQAMQENIASERWCPAGHIWRAMCIAAEGG